MPPAPPAAPTTDQIDATKMTDAQWAEYKANLGRRG
jgi:hypothetical protein